MSNYKSQVKKRLMNLSCVNMHPLHCSSCTYKNIIKYIKIYILLLGDLVSRISILLFLY